MLRNLTLPPCSSILSAWGSVSPRAQPCPLPSPHPHALRTTLERFNKSPLDHLRSSNATSSESRGIVRFLAQPRTSARKGGTAILETAALSFLGLGAQPPTAEWGSMLSAERNQVFSAPHLVFFPGLAIMINVLGFNLLGDGLRDALDPRLRK